MQIIDNTMNKMKINALRPAMMAIAFLMIASLSFAQSREKISVSDFHALSVSNAFVVEISVGNEESLEVEIEEEFREYLVTEVRNGTLIIKLDNGNWSRRQRRMKSSAKAFITVKTLDKINVSGAASIRTLDIIKSDRLQVELSGASVAKLEIETNDLNLEASGACVVNMEGTARDQNVRMSGSSIYRAFDLKSETAVLRVNGASNASLSVSDNLDVRASGASSIYYKGDPTLKMDTSGASSVKRRSR
ncbi:head GIN domain-containing protein [Roseivirga sp.]|uniref:head GIN domain-containing protein n=1 Tax=Roseivirga sp. TaxID=1964215 RepID=UPI003B8AB30D